MTASGKRRWYLIFVGILVVAVEGHPPQNVHLKDLGCTRPIFKKSVKECCQVTMEKVWGDMSTSFDTCGKKQQNRVGELVSRTTEESESPSTEISDRKESMHLTEMNNGSMKYQLFSTENQKNRHANRPRGRKECYMECVFKEEKLLKNNKVDKDAVLERFKSTKGNTEEWHKVMLNAAETCLQKTFGPPSNSLCNSEAFEVFECVFKEVFFHCPTWPENSEYCDSLREFYQKCPDNPPPPMDDMNTSAPEPEKEAGSEVEP